MKRPPGPGTLDAVRLARDREGRPERFVSFAREYGDVAYVRAGPAGFYLLSHPELTHGVLAEHAARFERAPAERRYSSWLLGDSLFTSEGELHARQRRLIEPLMYGDVPEMQAGNLAAVTERMIAGWEAGQTVDTLDHHERMITTVMMKVLFGAEGEKGDELADAVMAAIDANHHIPFAPTPIPRRLPFPSKRRFAHVLAELHRLIEEAAAHSAASEEPATDVLSRLRRAGGDNGGGMSAEQARDEALALYRGQNTVAASSLSWTWYLLSRHPEAEERFHAEIDSVVGDRLPTYEDFERLPYLLMVYREALRLYPPAWTILRRAIAPHRVRDYEIPEGATVVMSQYVHQRDERFWPDPARFDPERFAGGIPSDLPPCAYFPQSAGPHRCPGMDFLPVEMVMVLATIGRRWRLRPTAEEPIVPLAKASLTPSGGMPVVLERRAA